MKTLVNILTEAVRDSPKNTIIRKHLIINHRNDKAKKRRKKKVRKKNVEELTSDEIGKEGCWKTTNENQEIRKDEIEKEVIRH